MIHNDKPIKDENDDILGRNFFVDSIANLIADYNETESMAIGISGEWGSGKTSVLNLIEKKLKTTNNEKQKNVVIKFNPWHFTNQDQLLEQFFKFLRDELSIIDYSKILHTGGSCVKVVSIFVKLFTFLPFAEPMSKLLDQYSKVLKSFKKNKSLEVVKNKINKKLEKQKRKFIVFIDDIDRLNDEEIAQIFQLVKLTANFKNIVYVLPFDKDVVVSALEKVQSGFSEQYLDKIIQFPISLPSPSQKKLQNYLFSALNLLIADKQIPKNRLSELYMSNVYDTFKTLRNIKRFINAFTISYLPLKNEVDFIDFFSIRYIELFHFDAYKKLKALNKELTGNFYMSSHDLNRDKNKIRVIVDILIGDIKDNLQKSVVQKLLGIMFPKVATTYSHFSYIESEHLKDKFAGRIYVEEKFNLYFELAIATDDISTEEMQSVFDNYEQAKFLEYLGKLHESKVLSTFLRFIYSKMGVSKSKHFDEMMFSIFGIFYNVDNDTETSMFEMGNQTMILLVGKNYLLKQTEQQNIKFLITLQDKAPLGAYCEMTRHIGFNIGKYKGSQKEHEIIPLSIPEFEKIEKLLSAKIFKFLENGMPEISPDEFCHIQFFLCLVEPDKFVKWVKKHIKDDIGSILHFLSNCMHRGWVKGNTTYTSYKYISTLLEKIVRPIKWDDKIKNFILSKDFKTADRDYQRASLVYFMPQEDFGGNGDKEIDEFYKTFVDAKGVIGNE